MNKLYAAMGGMTHAVRAGLLALLCIAVILIGAVPAGAGNVNNWLTGSGLWSDKGSWSAGVVPDGSGYDVYIAGSGITVQVDGGYDICNLTLGAGNTLAIQNGVWANLGYEGGTSTITNNGTIALDANGASSKLTLLGNVVLEGSGTLSLGANNQQIINYISGASTSYSLTNGTNHTISGTGQIGTQTGFQIVNNGTISANISGKALYIYSGAIPGKLTNNGVLQAIDGGTLVLSSGTFTNNNVIRATNGSTVSLIEHATVTGGSLTSDATSKITGGNVTLNGITLTSGSVYQQTDGTGTTLTGTITNNGTIVLDAYSGSEKLAISGDVVLDGTGTVSLGAGNHYNINYIAGSLSDSLTIGANQTIAGCGYIGEGGMAIVNNGTISANDSSTALYLYSGYHQGTLTNNGTLQAVDGGTLVLSSGTFNNTNGVIQATNGSTVSLVEAAIVTGGSLTSDATSKITGGNITLNNVTLTAGSTYKQVDGTGTTLTGTITNNGTIILDAYSGSEKLAISGDVVLDGTGTVSMGAGNHYNINYITGSLSNSLTIGENQTIAGCGYIGEGGLTIVNNGTISANDSSTALYLYSGYHQGTLTNNGTLQAVDGGTLVLSSGTFNNTNGVIQATNGSTVSLVEAAIVTGGSLTSDATSKITGGNVTLNNVTLTSGSTYKQVDGTTTTLAGTITNNGTIVLNSYSGAERLYIESDVTLDGTGTISMGAGYHYNSNYITGSSSYTLTIGENQTIAGCGYIGEGGLTIVNNGTISANDSNGAALNIHAGWTNGKLTNNGTLAAASGDTLYINGVLTNYDSSTKTLTGGTYEAAGTIVLKSGYNITTNAATIVLSGAGSQILAGSADALANFSVNAGEGTFKIKNGRDFTTAGDFTNAGHVNVGSGSTLTIGKDGSGTYTQTSGTTKVNGTFIAYLIAIKGGSLTGTGTIEGSLISYGIINPGSSPGTLNVTGDYTQDATGTLLIELAGTTQGTEYDWLNISGTATLGGTLEVTLYGSYDLSDLTAGDTFTILTADSITGTFASIIYDDMDADLWKIIYGDTTITLEYIGSDTPTTTPEPATILLMVLGLTGLAAFKRKMGR